MNSKSKACAVVLVACTAAIYVSHRSSDSQRESVGPSAVVVPIESNASAPRLPEPAAVDDWLAEPTRTSLGAVEASATVQSSASASPAWTVPTDGRHIDPTAHATAEAMLSELWGPLSDDVIEELTTAGLDLETYAFQDVPSWEDLKLDLYPYLDQMLIESSFESNRPDENWSTEEGMRAMLEEMGDGTPIDGLQIDPATKAAFAELSQSIDRIELNLDSAIHARVIDSIEAGDSGCRAFPIALPRVSLGSPGVAVDDFAWYQSLSINGWVVDLSVRYDEAPEFITWKNELDNLIEQRFQLLASI